MMKTELSDWAWWELAVPVVLVVGLWFVVVALASGVLREVGRDAKKKHGEDF